MAMLGEGSMAERKAFEAGAAAEREKWAAKLTEAVAMWTAKAKAAVKQEERMAYCMAGLALSEWAHKVKVNRP